MLHNAPFHQGLNCWLGQKIRSSEQDEDIYYLKFQIEKWPIYYYEHVNKLFFRGFVKQSTTEVCCTGFVNLKTLH